MTKLSFVYFDVGGVAIKDFSDSPKWDVMMDIMGVPVSRRAEFDEYYHTLDTNFCLGEHEDNYLSQISAQFDLKLPAGFSMREYFIDHFDKNEGLWPIIIKLAKTTKIGLLTDQYPGMLDQIMARKLLPPVAWNVIVDSTQVGYRKPSPEIYELAETRSGVAGNEILFIDNRQKNLAPASARGWQTYFYDSSNYDRSTQDLAKFLKL